MFHGWKLNLHKSAVSKKKRLLRGLRYNFQCFHFPYLNITFVKSLIKNYYAFFHFLTQK